MNAVLDKGLRIFRTEGLRGIYSRLRRPAYVPDAFDRKRNIDSGAPVPMWKLKSSSKDLRDASPMQAITEESFREIMEHLPRDCRERTFIDLGSGKGRGLILALEAGFENAIGVELCYDLCVTAHNNLANLGLRHKAKIVVASASDYVFPAEPTVIFLFNPFGPTVLAQVLDHLRPGTVIAYAHPKHADLIHSTVVYRSENVGIWIT